MIASTNSSGTLQWATFFQPLQSIFAEGARPLQCQLGPGRHRMSVLLGQCWLPDVSTGCSGTPIKHCLDSTVRFSLFLRARSTRMIQKWPEKGANSDLPGLQERVFEVVMQHRAESFNVARARPARGTKTTEIQALGSNNRTQNYPAQIADILYTRQPYP